MNEHIRRNVPMPTTADAVAAIAAVMSDAESKAGAIRQAVRGLKDDFAAINANGDAGYLVSKMFATKLDAIATQFEAELYAIHKHMTDEAQARNIDLPQIESGGGR